MARPKKPGHELDKNYGHRINVDGLTVPRLPISLVWLVSLPPPLFVTFLEPLPASLENTPSPPNRAPPPKINRPTRAEIPTNPKSLVHSLVFMNLIAKAATAIKNSGPIHLPLTSSQMPEIPAESDASITTVFRKLVMTNHLEALFLCYGSTSVSAISFAPTYSLKLLTFRP